MAEDFKNTSIDPNNVIFAVGDRTFNAIRIPHGSHKGEYIISVGDTNSLGHTVYTSVSVYAPNRAPKAIYKAWLAAGSPMDSTWLAKTPLRQAIEALSETVPKHTITEKTAGAADATDAMTKALEALQLADKLLVDLGDAMESDDDADEDVLKIIDDSLNALRTPIKLVTRLRTKLVKNKVVAKYSDGE